ncbi:replication initiator protein [Capybara microvirus Cap1_SP_142]|nr:replication initiator protein [Capybara microvirus Cap1_SP_142]
MCIRPLHYWQSDYFDKETFKYPGFITGYEIKSVNYDEFKKRDIPASLGCNPKPIEIPCGKCPECLKKQQIAWVGRSIAESLTHPFNYFITLTYDDFHLPPSATVWKKDLTNFIKYVRHFIRCRYIAVGELGDASNRPHFHIILFCDHEIEDLIRLNERVNDFPYYTSSLISTCWLNKGLVRIGKATGASISYTLGYILRKEKKTAFRRQSQSLGLEFFSKHLKENYILPTDKGGSLTVSLPRTIKQKFGMKDISDHEDLQFKNELALSGLKEEDYRDLKEYLSKHPKNKKL